MLHRYQSIHENGGRALKSPEYPIQPSTSYNEQKFRATRGPFLTSPLAPRGELGPQGWNLSPRGEVYPFVHPPGVNTLYCLEEWRDEQRISPPGVNTLYCLEEWRGKQRISPPGDNFTPRGQIHPWGTTSPLGVKVFPRSEVKNGPQMRLWKSCPKCSPVHFCNY
jgi:hypothetical protein